MKKISLCLTACLLGIGAAAGVFQSLSSPRRRGDADEEKREEPKETESGSCDGL